MLIAIAIWLKLAAILFLASGFFLYNLNLHRNKTKPPIIAFIIGALSATVNALVYMRINREDTLMCVFGWVASLGNISTLIHMYRRSIHVFATSAWQNAGLVLMIAGLLCLKAFLSPLPAAFCAVLAGYCSLIPHFLNVYRHPENEQSGPWKLWLAGFLTMLALSGIFWLNTDPEKRSFAPVVYPLGFTLSTALIIRLISRDKKRAS